eukprot:scaffold236738_cov18-Tisochrysis_lutea.AAC.1
MARGCLATEGGWKCCPLTLPAAAVPGPQVFARFVMKKGWSSLAHAGSFEAKYVPPSQTELDAELARLSSTSGTVTSLTYQLAEEVKELEGKFARLLPAVRSLAWRKDGDCRIQLFPGAPTSKPTAH